MNKRKGKSNKRLKRRRKVCSLVMNVGKSHGKWFCDCRPYVLLFHKYRCNPPQSNPFMPPFDDSFKILSSSERERAKFSRAMGSETTSAIHSKVDFIFPFSPLPTPTKCCFSCAWRASTQKQMRRDVVVVRMAFLSGQRRNDTERTFFFGWRAFSFQCGSSRQLGDVLAAAVGCVSLADNP